MSFRNPAAHVLVALLIAGCASANYRVERLDGSVATALPLKFDSVSGVRKGDIVTAQVRFAGGSDHVEINLTVHLSPAAECTSANYHAAVDGKNSDGVVTCESLAFQGGQDAPAIGGVFLLKDSGGKSEYRVTMPSTQMQRRLADQSGHTLDTSQNVYIVREIMRPKDAANLHEVREIGIEPTTSSLGN